MDKSSIGGRIAGAGRESVEEGMSTPKPMTRRELLAQCAAMFAGLELVDRAGTGPCGRDAFSRYAVARAARPAAPALDASSALVQCLEGARVRWIVGWTPGGGFDTYSRLAEPFIEKALGVQIAIDNVPGAAGLVAATTLARARPDGRTLGILNGSAFLWNRNPDARSTPDLARDFTVLARVSRRQQVIVAGAKAGLRSVDDLAALAKRRPVIVGVTAPDSANFATLAAVTDLLGVRTEFVSGYPGSRELLLGLLRGDFEITSLDIESYIDVPGLESTHALLQITPERSPDPRLSSTPNLAGAAGLVTTRPDLFPGDAEHVRSVTTAITAYLEFGRLFAGPPGMTPALRDCVESRIHVALTDPGFAAAARRAGRSIDVSTGEEVRRNLAGAVRAVRPIEQVTAAAVRRIR
jgi:putative tricarboxylic transport membrane protein